MHRRANRAAIFTAVVAGHLLVLHYLPDFPPPPELSDREPLLPITLFPAELRPPRAAIAATSSRRSKHAPGGRKPPGERAAAASAAQPPAQARGIRPWIDWEKEADAAIAHRREVAAEAARRASALSRWREHVMPAPWAPHGPEFRWDEARTSQRFVPTIAGLVVHLNDRCLIIISPLALLGGCAIGHIPVYGDLFAHMDDPKDPDDSNVP